METKNLVSVENVKEVENNKINKVSAKKATAKAAEPAVYGDPLADDEMLEA